MLSRLAHAARAAGVAGVLLACVSSASAASAAPTETVIAGEHLQLVSVTDSTMGSMSLGETTTWDVGLRITTAGDADVEVRLEVLEATPGAFAVSVQRCEQRWTAAGCPGDSAELPAPPASSGSGAAIDAPDAAATPWYRIGVTLVGGSPGSEATLRLLAVGAGDQVSAGTGTDAAPLPDTGTSLWPAVAVAAGAVMTGIVLAALGGRAQRVRGTVEGDPA